MRFPTKEVETLKRNVSLLTAGVAIGAVGLGVWLVAAAPWRSDRVAVRVGPASALVEEKERTRRSDGAAVRDVTLTAAPATIRLGDRSVETWAFNGTVPGPEIRLRAGEVLRARVENRLPQPLTIHWHGVALRNDMDGVPGLTQEAIQPGGEMVYEFTAPDPGTYFYHPHTGTQLDRGLYAPLIVEEPSGTRPAERDITVMLDDWIDGTGESPDDVFERLGSGTSDMEGMEGMKGMKGMKGMEGMDEAAEEEMEIPTASQEGPLGDDTGDVVYPLYLINGRSPTSPATYAVEPGEQVRLRFINAASDTPFRVAVGGSRLTVVASDGFPVEPVTVDAILLGMGERYDALVTVPRSGVFPVVAAAEGKKAQALAVLRSGPGAAPMPDVKPAELRGKLLALTDLRAASRVALPRGDADRTYRLALTGDMATYRWGITAPKEGEITLPVREGERVRLVLENRSLMWHPIHLHGQTFQVVTGTWPGPRKDTVIVPAKGTVTVDLVADNPGQWLLHCHNIYHAEAGMQTTMSYVR